MNDRLSDRHRVLACALLGALVVYGYPITNYALHIDAELAASLGVARYDIALGRWGTGLVRLFVSPEPAAPFFQPLVSVSLLALAGVAVAAAIGGSIFIRCVSALLFVAFPQFAYQLEFPGQSDCVAFGIFAASLAVLSHAYALRTTGVRRLGWAAATLCLNVVAFSFYQAIVFVPFAIALSWGLARLLEREVFVTRIVVEVAAFGGVIAVAYAAEVAIGGLVQRALGIHPDAGYLDKLIGWRTLAPSVAFARSSSAFADIVFGRAYDGNAIYPTVWLALAAIIARSWRGRRLSARIAIAVFGLAVAVAPASIVMVLGQDQEPRTFLAGSVSFAVLWTLALGQARGGARVVAMVVVGGSLAFGSSHVSALFYADTMALAADESVGGRLMTTIYTADPKFDQRTTPVYLSGAYRSPNVWRPRRSSVFGASFFSWDNGDPSRIVAFLKVSGIADLRLGDWTMWPTYRREAASLPAWPNPNAARLIDGVLIVNLGE